MRNVTSNLGWGIGWGLGMAAFFSAYVLVIAGFRGSLWVEDGLHVMHVIAAYFSAGLGGGLLAGALRPLTRWPAGGMFVGMLAGIFVYFAVGIAAGEPPVLALGTAVLLGCAVGGLLGWELTTDQPADRHGIVTSKAEAPKLRLVQIVAVSAMALGASTCVGFAESEAAVTGGGLVFILGLAGAVLSQLFLWSSRLWAALRGRRTATESHSE